MTSEERRFKALDFLLDYSKGSLWWVKERLWGEAIPGFVKKRDRHPGLSLARKRTDGLFSVVPMALGTSKNHGKGFPVKGLSEKGVHDAPTYFDVLRPCSLRFDEFGCADGILQNRVKPRLTKGEVCQLNEFLSRKKVRYV